MFAVLYVISVHADREVLGHAATFDHINAHLLEDIAEANQLGVSVEFSAVRESTRPGKNGRNRVGTRRLALLVLAEVAGQAMQW